MSVDLSVLEGAYRRDLLAQPEAVANTVERLGTLPGLPARAVNASRVVLTGMGSSLFAQYPLQLRLIRAGRTAMVVESAELIHEQSQLLDENTLLVIVSQSGRSAETVQLLQLIDSRGKRPFVIGVTNTADSPLAQRADAVVPLVAGEEFSVSCKTYLSSLVALEWLGAALCGDSLNATLRELETAAPAARTYLENWKQHVTEIARDLAQVKHLFLAGRGASLAVVHTGALILKESTRFHAEGMSVPAFRHGPFEMVAPGVHVLIFGGESTTARLNTALARDIVSAGGKAVVIDEHAASTTFRLPHVPVRVRPVMEMLPVQMVSLALAALAHREPGRFERATKVTVVA